MVLPSDEDAALPLDPSKEALYQPASTAEPTPVLGGRPASVGAVRRNHLDAIFVATLRPVNRCRSAISDQVLWPVMQEWL